ncbi:DUF4838 domain-containing protein [Capillibacterium thermochitinicola]|uniref:DUF4838 domain-containing protein n=1 Tax=Capillibacterium thermochitinicola TaxID=2699427 RepID=A0A8J6LJM7_9FIRM|nr:DUF4838 domain-containing protein [Capillibacterium thermochitinicola]MBA2133910.1 DUF4838 domain-containing protein [Capillibacterium thermochitinicola]
MELKGIGQKKVVRIHLKTNNETTAFAAAELGKYLRLMLGQETEVVFAEEPPSGLTPGVPTLQLGLFADFPGLETPEVTDPVWDDAVYIRVENGKGVIAGNNPRSLLLAVYRFLTAAGCRWVRPGDDGELIPRKALADLNATVCERAAYRHRGICIEGAVSEENVRAVIDWLPKVGMNAYFIQFREAFTFFQRWYDHKHNPQQRPAGFTREEAREIVRRLEQEIKRRGLLYHAVGHGWTCEPLGLPGLGWDQKVDEEAPAEIAPFLAEIKGKRQIWQGIPLNTNLCYSNPEVREMIVGEIVRYLQEHPGIDLLHFWLADGSNNQCECAECGKARPADFYVQMLNDLDEQLTAAGLKTRIVFLVYVDLLWAPEKERIKNPERFVLMFAPITRSYTQSIPDRLAEQTIPPYVRNQLQFPSSVRENLAHLRTWQQMFSGDAFDFDYHLMWAHYFDPGYTTIARTAHQDIKNLKTIGLNGLISCQVQRAFMPTGLPMTVIGRALWDPTRSFSEIAADYYASAFGPDGEKCRELMDQLPDFLDELDPWAGRSSQFDEVRFLEKLHQTKRVIGELKALVAANRDLTNKCHRMSWRYLGIFLEVYDRFVTALLNLLAGRKEEADQVWEETKDLLCSHEDQIQMVFDVCLFIETAGRVLAKLKQEV